MTNPTPTPAEAIPSNINTAIKALRHEQQRYLASNPKGAMHDDLAKAIDAVTQIVGPPPLAQCGCKGNLSGDSRECVERADAARSAHYIECPACGIRTGYHSTPERAAQAWGELTRLMGMNATGEATESVGDTQAPVEAETPDWQLRVQAEATELEERMVRLKKVIDQPLGTAGGPGLEQLRLMGAQYRHMARYAECLRDRLGLAAV